MSVFDVKLLHQSPYSGLRRWECSEKLTELVLEFISYDISRVRKGKLNRRRLRFSTGSGYDCIDQDLLGGTGDGRTRQKFLDWLRARGIDC